MIYENETLCPDCTGELRYYDSVSRIVRTQYRKTCYILIRRLRCQDCSSTHREIPDVIFPFKQYEAEIIIGVLEGYISPETFGYEDYPCEMTMKRWRDSRKTQAL